MNPYSEKSVCVVFCFIMVFVFSSQIFLFFPSGYSNKTKSVEELNQNNTVATMNGTATNNDCGDITTPTTTTTTTTTTTPVIRAPPDDSDVEMESQDNQIDHNNSCNGSSKNNGASNGYQNGNSHTINNCDEDGCEGADDEMGE